MQTHAMRYTAPDYPSRGLQMPVSLLRHNGRPSRLSSCWPLLPISYRKVGGIRFLRLGSLTLSWSVGSRGFRPLKGTV